MQVKRDANGKVIGIVGNMQIENGQHRIEALKAVLEKGKIADDDKLRRQIPVIVYVRDYLTESSLTELRVNAQSERIVKPDTLVERLWKMRASEVRNPGCLKKSYVKQHFSSAEEGEAGIPHLLGLARMDMQDPELFQKTMDLIDQ